MTQLLADDRTQPMTPPMTDQVTADRGLVQGTLLASGYALSAFPIALPAFVLVVVGLALGLGLSVLIGGVLLLSLAVVVARGFAGLERIRLRGMLDRAAPTPSYLRAAPGAGYWKRRLTPLRDPQSWLDVVWCLVGLVTGTVAFAVTLAWWALALGGLTGWLWLHWVPQDPEETTLASLIGLGDGRAAEDLLYLAIGAVALLTLPLVVRLVALTHASLASVLLSSRADLQAEVRRATGGRDAARSAEAVSLRRLERDIHDGPQQRLVRLTMDLGRARAQLGDDAGTAGQTLDAAMAQARETLDELRALSRGIAPPLLVDRGLEAALRELVLRSSVPVSLEVELRELPPHVETALYFVVSEALTNVNKHSGASAAEVAVVCNLAGVVVAVHDDGAGGAHTAKGSGLAGLEQRLRAVDGRLTVDSPAGGGTTLTAVVPSPA